MFKYFAVMLLKTKYFNSPLLSIYLTKLIFKELK